mgnify:CR=1 FL=1|jgi:hypothetical protein|tara:strand:+ start:265 stop:456 length:192 start_codon:yes stop_codon:yes gene_type:complete
MNEENPLRKQYEELKSLLLAIELDLSKNISGNKSAGIRFRKQLREVKKLATELVKASVDFDKQ